MKDGESSLRKHEYSNMKPVLQYQAYQPNSKLSDPIMATSGDEQASADHAKIPRTKREYLELHKKNMVINAKREKVQNQELRK